MTNLCTWSAILAYVSCHIQKDQMKIPVDIRGAFEMHTLETITQDNLNYMANGGIRSDAQLFHNYISKPIFNIPLSQVRIDCTLVIAPPPSHPSLPYRCAWQVSI